MDAKTLAVLIPLLPLAGAILVGLVGLRGLRGRSHWLVILPVAAALVAAARLTGNTWLLGERVCAPGASVLTKSFSLYHWMSAGAGNWLDVSFRVDPLTCTMLIVVLAVSLLVVMYSVGYMRDHHGHPERGYERFFAFLAIFVFSMCMLVLAGNFLLLYLGWELVGLSSYLLIGFYYQRPSAAAAAKKAFLVNRIGDFGFGLGIFLIYYTFRSLDYETVFNMVRQMKAAGGAELDPSRITTIALLLFCGAVGKSAQLPLHVWLPDAMEGPTPVSALIHAATMVTAGVYMVARCNVIFAASAYAMWIVATIGAVTAIFAATIALTQFDMKRILAYSTLSQLGYMFLGLGVGAFDSAIFHLYTHAFFKALLFLGAGSVMHAMAGTIDIRRFGGLARALPITATTFWIGGLALSGFPLLAGFWSKDEIVHAALGSTMPWLGGVAIVTAWLTAFYTFRMIFLAFHGKERLPHGVEHAHESGPWMTAPLLLLAIGAVFAGYAGVTIQGGGFLGVFEPHGRFHQFLSSVLPQPHAETPAAGHESHWLMYASAGIAVWGIFTAWFFYRRRPTIPMAIALAFEPAYRLLYNKYYVDELYDTVLVRPLRWFGEFCYGLDRFFINGILWFISAVPRAIGYGLKRWQQGALQGYALGMTAGVLIILWWMLVAT
ncbi:MAG TPA: NADH-quinone oxidoreductase subunit L [Phycisphaerae bacterium]|nr:NADH-quinone oxidoreductase subunit L [Phycisphaerae bacterium]